MKEKCVDKKQLKKAIKESEKRDERKDKKDFVQKPKPRKR